MVRALLWQRGEGNIVQTCRLFDCSDTPQSRPDTRTRLYAPSSSPACQGNVDGLSKRRCSSGSRARSANARLAAAQDGRQPCYRAYRATAAMMMSMDMPLWATTDTLTGGRQLGCGWRFGMAARRVSVEMFRLHLAQGIRVGLVLASWQETLSATHHGLEGPRHSSSARVAGNTRFRAGPKGRHRDPSPQCGTRLSVEAMIAEMWAVWSVQQCRCHFFRRPS